mmetsp:Transcript_39684/g.71244  ORF Transcript_39684/g.71244 Transcript_39684/m.71244 type:complete len:243 (+) Transcript_39684:719-1447(+)
MQDGMRISIALDQVVVVLAEVDNLSVVPCINEAPDGIVAGSLADDHRTGQSIRSGWHLDGDDAQASVWRDEDLTLLFAVAEHLDVCGGVFRKLIIETACCWLPAVNLEEQIAEPPSHLLVGCCGCEGSPHKFEARYVFADELHHVWNSDPAVACTNVWIDNLVDVISVEDIAQLFDEGTKILHPLKMILSKCKIHLRIDLCLHGINPHQLLLSSLWIVRKCFVILALDVANRLRVWCIVLVF